MSKCSNCGADTELFDGGIPICAKCSQGELDRSKILERLHQDREIARRRRDEASSHFDDIIRQVPHGGIPYPDSQERIRRASHDYTRAQRDLANATARLNDYLIDGTVPPQLKEG